MQRERKAIGIGIIIILGYIAFGVFSLIMNNKGFTFPHGSFLFWPLDRYMDFFNVNKMVSELSPYVDYHSSYPPLILGIAYFFSLLADYKNNTSHEVANLLQGKISLVFFFILFTSIIIFLLINFLNKEKMCVKNKWLIVPLALCFTFTAPYIWALDRGNYLIVAIVFYLVFVYFYNKNDKVAAVFLGLAAAVKIYPLLLFGVYLVDKNWKALKTALLVLFVSSVIPFLCFKGGFIQNIIELGYTLVGFGGGYPNEVPNIYYCVGLTSLLRMPFAIWNNLEIPDGFPTMLLYLIIGTVLTIWSLILIRNEQSSWKRIMIMTILMVFLTPNSYMYNLTYLMPVFLVFITNENPQQKLYDWIYLVLFGAIMVPKAYYYMHPQHGIGIQVLIDGLLLLCVILFYNIGDRSTRIGRDIIKEETRGIGNEKDN